MDKEQVAKRIIEIGIVPVVRAPSAEKAMLAAEAVCRGGIPIVEVTMTVPRAIEAISYLAKKLGDDVLIGAGTVLDADTAERCVSAGAEFIVSPGFDLETVEYAHGECAHAHRSDCSLEGGERFRQDFSLRKCWRGEIYQGVEGAFAASSHDSYRRGQSLHCRRISPRRGRSVGYWRGVGVALRTRLGGCVSNC